MDVDELKLTCWIRSERDEPTFQVRIQKTASVNDLQDAIKSKAQRTLCDVDAFTLTLYKPKTAVSMPYRESLKKLILSTHGELLRCDNMLSDVFLEPPPVHHIHIIVDVPSRIVCWLRGADLNDCFAISIHPGEGIEALIPRIKEKREQLRDVSNGLIHLYKISGDEGELGEHLKKTGEGERLLEAALVSNSFLDVPVLDPLRVVIDIAIYQSPTLCEIHEAIPDVDEMQKYRDIFLRVKDWGKVDESDVEMNGIEEAGIRIPHFVTAFQRKLLQTPYLPPSAQMQTESFDPEQYFEPYQTLTAKDPREERRHASESEVFHTSCIVLPNWPDAWEHDLKEPLMTAIFFELFLCIERARKTAGRDKRWPITLVVECEGVLRQYCPKSDFLISNSSLPRLLVEVNSAPHNRNPKDLRRMLSTGACVVRFANKYVGKYRQGKTFVLCAFFVSATATATRYNLYQIPNDRKVYYTTEKFPLGDPLGRVKFARHLYNLRAELKHEEDEDAKDAVTKLVEQVRKQKMDAMVTKPSRGTKRKRAECNDDDSTGGGGGSGHIAQLRAHGYEVEPEVIVDDSGGTWESIYKTPDHILTVYNPTNQSKALIAKKVRKNSDELEILKFLSAMRPRSDHIIPLVDSFDQWAIFPKMIAVVYASREELQSKVSQVCLGLVQGLAYLHRLCIAHRDIKLDNLVVDKNFTLQIIDFDVAMRVKDEDEEVGDQCGTERWMAPEVKQKLWHSPIKADRWSCGLVLMSLLGVSDKEDMSLKAFARGLLAHDPKERPSLLEWDRYLAPPFSDSDASKTSHLLRDRVEDEIMKPNVKKQRFASYPWC